MNGRSNLRSHICICVCVCICISLCCADVKERLIEELRKCKCPVAHYRSTCNTGYTCCVYWWCMTDRVCVRACVCVSEWVYVWKEGREGGRGIHPDSVIINSAGASYNETARHLVSNINVHRKGPTPGVVYCSGEVYLVVLIDHWAWKAHFKQDYVRPPSRHLIKGVVPL